MEKSKFVKIYISISLVVVFALLVVNLSFLGSMPNDLTYASGFYGTVSKSLFTINFENITDTINIVNWPLIVSFVLLVFSVIVAVIVGVGEKMNNKVLQDGVVYNVVALILVVVSNVVYTFMIPDTVNGLIKHQMFLSKFEVLDSEFRTAFNFGFILLFIYLIMNIIFLFASTNVVAPEHDYKGKEIKE